MSDLRSLRRVPDGVQRLLTVHRRAGTVPNAEPCYGPGSAAHRYARATRCAASGERRILGRSKLHHAADAKDGGIFQADAWIGPARIGRAAARPKDVLKIGQQIPARLDLVKI